MLAISEGVPSLLLLLSNIYFYFHCCELYLVNNYFKQFPSIHFLYYM
ncbi:Uncharacterised protein [Klebsiella pneumoniae]|nr:Uncharacterised protein [Klebsiella pneumoniae]SLQ97632.1 Uncharacterised protein [Klebsiella pneumoniae]SLQ99810.1 Uncharacterised protein [Klebsiella pneumoniae]SLR00051.1 Uncharacterised protein [Klebsiella pneumoniae]SLR27505.1 Uncharacterised protein [Klebsiella pneumoniae]